MSRTTALFSCTVLVSGLVSAGTVLLEDGFNGYRTGATGAPLWQAYSGQWQVANEGLEGTDCEGNFIAMGAVSGRKQWTDYTLSLRLRVVSRGSDWRDGAWIGVRFRNTANAYTVGFYSRETALHKASKGKATGDKNALGRSPTTIKDDRWHDVAVAVEGQRIQVRLDGKAIIDVEDGDAPVTVGCVALAARKYQGSKGTTKVVFDDIRVEAMGIAPDGMKWTASDAAQAVGKRKSLLEFMRARRNVRYPRVPRQVLAFYYTWYGTPERHGRWIHWNKVKPDEHDIASSTHYPAKGAYDSHDPEIIDWHIDLAKEHGLTGFIATWWGPGRFDDRAFPILLDRAAKKDFKVTVYWETAPSKGQAQIDQAVSDLLYVLNRYGSHPAFLRVDGKPVIFVYGRVMNQVPLRSWPAIISDVEDEYPKGCILIADGYRESFARVLDGLHTYNICGWVKGKTPDQLRSFSANSFKRAVGLAKSHGKISCITIIPGYDDTKIRKPGLNAERQGGQTYRVLWEQAIAADPDWVVITSWNEWHEGSEIEPSWEDGDKYIKLTGEYAPRFMATRHSQVAVPESASGLDAKKAAELRDLYRDKTIGILPDYGGSIPFWLADVGVALKELTWRELLDPDVFNAKSLPLVLYTSGERYVQSLDKDGDVERAILRYLGEGGLLVAMSYQPFPFYYNEKGESIVAAGRLGFPIAGSGALQRNDIPEGAEVRGWEKPPTDAELTFQVDTDALPGLTARASFPTSGDRRWRPATPALGGKEDVYVPLARLRDQNGKLYGDGIVYIEHKKSAPPGGRNLYVWMRMLDVLGADDALFALFRFAVQKAGGPSK